MQNEQCSEKVSKAGEKKLESNERNCQFYSCLNFFFSAVMYTMTKNNWGGKGLLSACSGSPLLRAGQELKAEAEDMEEHCL